MFSRVERSKRRVRLCVLSQIHDLPNPFFKFFIVDFRNTFQAHNFIAVTNLCKSGVNWKEL